MCCFVGRDLRAADHGLVLRHLLSDVALSDRMYRDRLDLWYPLSLSLSFSLSLSPQVINNGYYETFFWFSQLCSTL